MFLYSIECNSPTCGRLKKKFCPNIWTKINIPQQRLPNGQAVHQKILVFQYVEFILTGFPIVKSYHLKYQ